MSITPQQFDENKLSVGKPVPGEEGGTKFATLPILYDGKPFKFFLTDAVNMTRLSENPQKPGQLQLSQGIVLENETLKKMFVQATRKIFEGLIEHRNDSNMPAFMRNMMKVDDIMQAKKFGTKVKGLVHFPELKDAGGKPNGVIDETANPVFYAKMIQSGAAPKKKDTKPNEIFTKFWSAAILNPENDYLIKKGKVKESSFEFKALDIFKSKSAMKGIPSGAVNDIYVAAGTITIRSSISEVYITEFVSGESEVKKNLRTHLIKEGRANISGPTALPNAEPDDVDETVNTDDGPMPSGADVKEVGFGSDGGFTVKVSQ